MKTKNKFLKNVLIVGSITSGVIGLSSLFNEVQATGGSSKTVQLLNCYNSSGVLVSFGNSCVSGGGYCSAHGCPK